MITRTKGEAGGEPEHEFGLVLRAIRVRAKRVYQVPAMVDGRLDVGGSP